MNYIYKKILFLVFFNAFSLNAEVSSQQAVALKKDLALLREKVAIIVADNNPDAGKVSRILESVPLISTASIAATVSMLNELSTKTIVNGTDYSFEGRKLKSFFDISTSSSFLIQKRADELYNALGSGNLLGGKIAQLSKEDLAKLIAGFQQWLLNYPV